MTLKPRCQVEDSGSVSVLGLVGCHSTKRYSRNSLQKSDPSASHGLEYRVSWNCLPSESLCAVGV